MEKYTKDVLIFSDLDSTLLDNDGFFTKYTRETVRELYKQGIYLIPITARSTSDVMRQAKRLGIDKFGGIIGANNGSQLFDFKNNEWILNESLNREVIDEIFNDTYGKYEAKVHYFGDDSTYVYGKGNNSLYWAQMMGSDYVIVESSEEIIEKINHLTIILKKDITQLESDKFYTQMVEKYERLGVDIHKYTNRVFEVCPKNINKGYAVEKVIEYLNIDNSVTKTYAFGDGENDLKMFDKVDVGVAMENAIFELKNVADEKTVTNDKDGVAKYIREKVLK